MQKTKHCLQSEILPPHLHSTRHEDMTSRAQTIIPYVRLSAHMPWQISSSACLLCQQFQPSHNLVPDLTTMVFILHINMEFLYSIALVLWL